MRKKRMGLGIIVYGIIRSYAILYGKNISRNGASHCRAFLCEMPIEPSGGTKMESETDFKSGLGRFKYRRDFPR